jgi:pyrimidine-specific ribonucleoside hydrolase
MLPIPAWTRWWLRVTSIAVVLVFVLSTGGPASASRRATTGSAAKDAPRVIIDTDLSKWWDDVTALGLANVLHQQGTVRVLGIVSDVPNRVAVAAIDAIDTAYGNAKIPIGAVTSSDADTFEHGYTDELARRLPHSVADSTDVPNAVALYRRLLAGQRDKSVTIVSLGGYTNLAGLLESRRGQGSALDGRALVAKKVKRLVIMDGFFPGGGPAFTNQQIDLAAANTVVGGAGWPTPVAWADGTVGVATRVGSTLCATVAADHPMRIAYESLFGCGPPKDGDWDAPALLYALGDHPATFSELGQGGAAVINPQGGLSWDDASPRAHDVYVHVVDQAALNQRIDELLVAH